MVFSQSSAECGNRLFVMYTRFARPARGCCDPSQPEGRKCCVQSERRIAAKNRQSATIECLRLYWLLLSACEAGPRIAHATDRRPIPRFTNSQVLGVTVGPFRLCC